MVAREFGEVLEASPRSGAVFSAEPTGVIRRRVHWIKHDPLNCRAPAVASNGGIHRTGGVQRVVRQPDPDPREVQRPTSQERLVDENRRVLLVHLLKLRGEHFGLTLVELIQITRTDEATEVTAEVEVPARHNTRGTEIRQPQVRPRGNQPYKGVLSCAAHSEVDGLQEITSVRGDQSVPTVRKAGELRATHPGVNP